MSNALLPRASLWKAVLLASLCLNVLLAAYVATQWVHSVRATLVTAAPPRLMELVASRLPSPDADVLWRAYRAREAEFGAAQSDYQNALAEAAGELKLETVDWEKFKTLVREARDRRLKVGDLAIATFIASLPKMSAEGRKGLVRNIAKGKAEGK